MKRGSTGKQRTRTRQKLSRKMLIAAGISVITLTVVLVIYFQFFKNETIKAQEKENLTQEDMPVDLHITEPLIAEPDTLSREGNRYKIAKPLHLTPVINE